ncbi:MAG: sulfate transporter substrate-binding protein [Jatrophihabitantaceae bacterium]|nr:sulfate transporter substrate-binding protein [Jatrophihabitantaceae bacterium]
MKPPPRRGAMRAALAALGATALAVGLAACGGSSGGGGGGGTGTGGAEAAPVKLALVGYSVAKSVYDSVQPAFSATDKGAGVSWDSSYGASGDQSRAVVNGLAADYVAFSLEPDVTRLVDAGLVDPTWNSGPTKGIVSDSVVVFVVRKGNPKNIKTWDDVVKDGVKIITPNPGSSGAAKWNIMGAYAHGLSKGGAADGKDFLTKFYNNIVSLPASGREATSAFTSGTGDVLISYENEAILAKQNGQSLDYVVPEDSFLIENPAAVTKTAPAQAKAFLDFVLSVEGQKLFAQKGFRPVIDGVDVGKVQGANDESKPFPTIKKLHTVAELGGWKAINSLLFDSNTGLVTQIQKEKGLG